MLCGRLHPAGLALGGLALLATLGTAPSAAIAQEAATCRVVGLQMVPTPDLQIVAWIEDTEGNYVETIFITRTTGSYGLGNRPGIMDFDSGPLWPYGRRLSTFPVWAARHGMSWPAVLFQDGVDTQLSHPLSLSSRERFYCRPIKSTEPLWDAQSCASTVYTDKGVLSSDQTSKYPPRTDIDFDPDKDDPSVEGMAALNPFDGVSHATPRGDEPYDVSWPVPAEMATGDYVLWVEVSREFDQNETYSYASPDVPWEEYGEPYRGQPSVVYRLPFALSEGPTRASTLDYVGYGDPDGVDGELRPPDATITADQPGSGSSRLLVAVDGEEMYRVRVAAFGSDDAEPPESAGEVQVVSIDPTAIEARFVAPGDDGLDGTVTGYEVRYLATGEIDEENFSTGTLVDLSEQLVAAGAEQNISVPGLVPRTAYSIGVRAYDECGNLGPVRTFEVTTPRAEPGAVDACFVATAAYGSLLAGEVSALRGFRDVMLRTHVVGELAVESYYTFGPLLARFIGPSETLRRSARAALGPVVTELHAAGF